MEASRKFSERGEAAASNEVVIRVFHRQSVTESRERQISSGVRGGALVGNDFGAFLASQKNFYWWNDDCPPS